MKRSLAAKPPSDLVAYEIEPGRVLFVHALPKVTIAGLTPAEQEVLTLVLDGYDNASIADARRSSPRTVANHLASIFRKLGVASRAELAAKIGTMA